MYVIMILFIASNHLRQLSRVRSNAIAIGGLCRCAGRSAPTGRSAADVARMYHVARYFKTRPGCLPDR